MKKGYLWIGIISVILGMVIAFQFKYVQKTYLNGGNPTQLSTEITKELNALRLEKEALSQHVDELKTQLDQINESAAAESVVVKSLNSELEKIRKFAGLTEVKGPGIMISVDNPPSDFTHHQDLNIVNEYTLILQLINELNAAGAEAISINGQRIISRSEIRLAGTTVKVNKVPINLPYNIRVIGNSDTLSGAISQRYGIVPTIQDRGYEVDILTTENVEIPAYNGSTKFDYAKTVE